VSKLKLNDLLESKDFKYRAKVTVKPGEKVSAAGKEMAKYDRGSLTVCDNNGRLAGIITERDIVRKCIAEGKDPRKTKIEDIMTQKIVVAGPEDDVNYAISVMKELRIRHLPIADENSNVIGMISMRDLLGVQLEQCNTEVRFLTNYISSY
jgi:CBS domain-containing protein